MMGLREPNRLLKKLRETGRLATIRTKRRQRSTTNCANVVLSHSIHTLTGYCCKFSQLQYCRILSKSVNVWPSNRRNEKGGGELFRDTVYYYTEVTNFLPHASAAGHDAASCQFVYLLCQRFLIRLPAKIPGISGKNWRGMEKIRGFSKSIITCRVYCPIVLPFQKIIAKHGHAFKFDEIMRLYFV